MSSKMQKAAGVLSRYGMLGVSYKVLGKLRIRAGKEWFKRKMSLKHCPYTPDPLARMKCPHCQSSLSKTDDGMMCGQCANVYV